MQPDRRSAAGQTAQLFRFATLGLEVGGGLIGFVLAGWLVDRTFGTGKIGTVTGAILGAVGAMYHLITRTVRIQREQQALADREQDDPHEGDS